MTDQRRVSWALWLTGGFLVVEVIGGFVSGSLALLADAGHMLTDAGALALALAALRASARPATIRHTYGQHRFQVLAAFVNGATLIGISAWIALEAIQRLIHPVAVEGLGMLAVAVAGLFANLASFLILHGGDPRNLNLRGAALHVLSDLLGSAAAIVGAVVIMLTGWMPVDPLLSLLVVALVLRSAWRLVVSSWNVLMEATPEGVEVDALRAGLIAEVPGVLDVHHVHVWSLSPQHPMVTLHARIAHGADGDAILVALGEVLARRFELPHATIQIEREICADQGH